MKTDTSGLPASVPYRAGTEPAFWSSLFGLNVFQEKRPRVLVLWPHPRSERIWRSLQDSSRCEEADAFTHLRENGFGFATLDPCAYPLNPLAHHGSALAGIDILRFVRLLMSYARFDAVVSMDSSSGLLFSLLKRLGLKKPLVIIDPALTMTYRLRRRIHDFALPAADCVIVFGSGQEQFLKERYGNRVRVRFIRHRIDTRFFDPGKVRSPEPPEPYLLAVGDDVGRDFRTLLRAAEALPFRVIIKSRSPMAEPLPANVKVIADRISFEELRALYHHARLVALPLYSTLHASGINTLLESMAMGKAVVVSNSEGIADYVEHRKNAWIVPPEEPAELRSAIATLWANQPLREDLGSDARRFCLTHCSMPFYMRQVSSAIAQSSRTPSENRA